MPNAEQEQDPEGEASGCESGEWHSDDEEDEDSDNPSDEEEVDSPPRRERRSKISHNPTSARGKATTQTGQSSKRRRTSSPAPTEKASKQPKATPSKPPKALPKIKVVVPIFFRVLVRLDFLFLYESGFEPTYFVKHDRLNSKICSATTSGTSTRQYEDEDVEDAVTSNPGTILVILLSIV